MERAEMKRREVHRDLVLIGIAIGFIVNLPPVDGWIDRAFAGTWGGVPWVILAVLWIGLGVWAYVVNRRPQRGSSTQKEESTDAGAHEGRTRGDPGR